MWPRPPHMRNAQSLSAEWINFSESVIFSIDPDRDGETRDGATGWDFEFDDDVGSWDFSGATIFISPSVIVPLLSSQLTISERLRGCFYLASTILHEIAVSL